MVPAPSLRFLAPSFGAAFLDQLVRQIDVGGNRLVKKSLA
jgi:hypothetical protein